ncbi:MAG: hypothetical protein ABIF84_00660 [Patescibacteria group bacterium]
MKGVIVLKRETLVSAKLLVAGLLKKGGEVVLVDWHGQLSLPTGKMDAKRDTDLRRTLVREMEEEFPKLTHLEIIESLGVVVRNGNNTLLSFEILSCNIQGEIDVFMEGKFAILIRPVEALKLPWLDILSREAITRYVKRYPGIGKREEGKNDL